MSLIELKARAYDIVSQIEYLQIQLRDTNAEIAKLAREEAEKQQQTESK